MTQQLGRLYSLSTAAPDAAQRLHTIMAECGDMALLVDVRSKPNAWRRGHTWTRKALECQHHAHYVWRGASLGEETYNVPGGPFEGVPWLTMMLRRGWHCVLLCSCEGEACHRGGIVRLVREALPGVKVMEEVRV